MKSIMFELITIDPGLDKLFEELKKNYQIKPDGIVLNKIRNDSFRNIGAGNDYKLFLVQEMTTNYLKIIICLSMEK